MYRSVVVLERGRVSEFQSREALKLHHTQIFSTVLCFQVCGRNSSGCDEMCMMKSYV